MSLFVGNLSRNVRYEDLRDAFESKGPCQINKKVNFAFIDYDNDADAEKAKQDLQSKDMEGLSINIEWSKKSRNFDDAKRHGSGRDSGRDRGDRGDRGERGDRPPRRDKDDITCFNCNKRGHFARDCKERRRSRSRDRNPRRRSRSPRGGDRRRQRSRSGSNDRRDRSRSNGDRDRRNDRFRDRRDDRRDDRRGGSFRDREDFRSGRNRDDRQVGRDRKRDRSSESRNFKNAGGDRRRNDRSRSPVSPRQNGGQENGESNFEGKAQDQRSNMSRQSQGRQSQGRQSQGRQSQGRRSEDRRSKGGDKRSASQGRQADDKEPYRKSISRDGDQDRGVDHGNGNDQAFNPENVKQDDANGADAQF